MNNSIPTGVREFIDLFSTDLEGVTFPQCDKATLTALVADVEQAASELALAEARCVEARTALLAAEDVLLQRAARGQAYARIYAEGDAELTLKVDGIAIPRGGRRTSPPAPLEAVGAKRRARNTKSEPLLGVIEATTPATGTH